MESVDKRDDCGQGEEGKTKDDIVKEGGDRQSELIFSSEM